MLKENFPLFTLSPIYRLAPNVIYVLQQKAAYSLEICIDDNDDDDDDNHGKQYYEIYVAKEYQHIRLSVFTVLYVSEKDRCLVGRKERLRNLQKIC